MPTSRFLIGEGAGGGMLMLPPRAYAGLASISSIRAWARRDGSDSAAPCREAFTRSPSSIEMNRCSPGGARHPCGVFRPFRPKAAYAVTPRLPQSTSHTARGGGWGSL